jgi:hypothetical protein
MTENGVGHCLTFDYGVIIAKAPLKVKGARVRITEYAILRSAIRQERLRLRGLLQQRELPD